MREIQGTDFKKIFKKEDYSLIGPDGSYYSDSRALEEAWKREMRFKSPLTGMTYEESDQMRKAEEEYIKQYYKKNETDKKQIKK